jgi:hypothetical protein
VRARLKEWAYGLLGALLGACFGLVVVLAFPVAGMLLMAWVASSYTAGIVVFFIVLATEVVLVMGWRKWWMGQ